jgi:cytochrome c oxidase subunit II
MRQSRKGRLCAVVFASAALLLAGCARDAPSTLDPTGYGARRVAGLWWLLFWIAVGVFVVVVALLGWSLLRRRRAGTQVRAGDAVRFIVVAGLILPLLILGLVYAISLGDMAALGNRPGAAAMTIEVTGHEWWWEARYPQTGAVTANEIHIPVGETVRVKLTTADVLHSFWVPQLAPKTDMIAGRTNDAWLRAEKPGRYRGQCAEYCGLQHAHMAFLVVAEPRADFDSWLNRLSRPRQPSTAAEQRGLQVFEQSACASCHTIRGTTAQGRVGPDLSNVGSRWSIGAGTVPNDPGHLGGWIANSQTVKPGNKMPPQPVAAADMQDLLAYLESLK